MNQLTQTIAKVEYLEKLYQEILNTIDTPLVLIDKISQTLTYVNNKALSHIDLKVSELVAHPVKEIIKIFNEDTLEVIPLDKALEGDNEALRQISGDCLIEIGGTNPLPVKIKVKFLEIDNNQVLLSFSDISQQRNLADSLNYHKNHDQLTGLQKRASFERAIQQAIEDSQYQKKFYLACQIKITHLKVINDLCGSVAGDELIREVTSIIQNHLCEGDILCRISGSEFGLIMPVTEDQQEFEQLKLILETISEYEFEWGNKPLPVSVNIGATRLNQFSEGWINCMSQMDAACLAAATESENTLKVFSDEDDDVYKSHTEMSMVSTIISAIQNDRLELYYQMIVPVIRNKYQKHIEILIRMKDEQGDLISPNDFLPAAETYNLILLIDKWVIKNTLLWFQQNISLIPRDLICNINLSGFSISQDGFKDFILSALDSYQIPHDQICFEITETAAIKNFHKASEFIKEIKKAGCIFALDDFGAGMSSFGYLKNLNVDILKIDGALIRQLHQDKIDYVMVQSINEIAHIMQLQTVAEYVENDKIFQRLKLIGIDFAQGYHFSIPAPLSQLKSFS